MGQKRHTAAWLRHCLVVVAMLLTASLAAANPCKDSYDLHDCDEVAECVSEQPGNFHCKCPKGYTDNSPDKKKPGRKCDKDTGCQVCSPNAVCEQTYDGVKCHCKPGFLDQSPNPQSQPGTVCQTQAVNECASPWLNTCPPNADCIDTSNSYRCVCKTGFNDLYPQRNPGHHCEEIKKKVDPCETNTHNCHTNARCSNKQVNDPILTVYAVDTSSEYTCTCLHGFKDKSPDLLNKPGRICIKPETCESGGQVCNPNAICQNLAEGFTCQCNSGYEDRSPNPAKPGRTCVVKDPCANNECDSAATCYPSSNGGYTCRCNTGYTDQSSILNMNIQGRNCVKKQPCQEQCPPPSQCVEVYGRNGYQCQCPAGYLDSSQDKTNKPGIVCALPAIEAKPSTVKPDAVALTDDFPCGQTNCKRRLKEVCVNGVCQCAEGQGRATSTDQEKSRNVCQPLEKIPFAVRIVEKGPESLLYSSDFGNNQSAPYVQISNDFEKDMDKAISSTVFGPRYITTDVSYIAHPKTVNSSWPDGLLLNFTAGVTPGTVDRCELWDEMVESFQSTNQQIGGGQLKVAADVDLLDPCPTKCGGVVCNAALGEICIANSVCGCPEGQKRASKADHCTPVEGVQIPLWVIRKNKENLVHNSTFNNPQDPLTKQYVYLFESGVAQSYPQTSLKNSFVVAEVNDILHPNEVNDTWNNGIVYNSTVYFKKGSVSSPLEMSTSLVRFIIDKNNYQIGQSGLYLNPCENNTCSVNSKCIPQVGGYKCECLPGYNDDSPKGSIVGSVCISLPCSDINYCPLNSTCVNLPNHEAACQCKKDFVDISQSETRLSLGLDDIQCLNPFDVCSLGLHNCSSVAICTPKPPGSYFCACPANYVDGDPSNPGHNCAGLLCSMCNLHGDCVTDPKTNNVTCACAEGYTGEFCQLSASSIPTILFIILALLFLLLALCCLLYLCSRCRCFKRERAFPFASLDNGSSEYSIYSQPIGIPRAKLDRSDSFGSDYTIREEVERVVTTDTTKTEHRTIETEEDVHEVMERSHSSAHQHEYYPS